MKKKTMAFVMSLLMIVALVGVGFATWVITADSKETVEGNITVDTVVDTKIKIKATFTNQSGEAVGQNLDKVIFGAPETSNSGWLQNDSTEKENLNLNLTLELSNLVQTVDQKTYGLTSDGIILAIADKSNKYDAAEAAKYVGTLNSVLEFDKLYLVKKGGTGTDYFLSTTDAADTVMDGKDVEVTEEGGTAKITISLTFKWGSEFDNKNPYTFYTGKDINGKAEPAIKEHENETNGDRALRVLKDLNALNAEKFVITITAKSANLTK